MLRKQKTKTQPHGVVLNVKKTKTQFVDFNRETDTKASTSTSTLTLNRENNFDFKIIHGSETMLWWLFPTSNDFSINIEDHILDAHRHILKLCVLLVKSVVSLF